MSTGRRVAIGIGAALATATFAVAVVSSGRGAPPFTVPEAPAAAPYVPPPGAQTGPEPAPNMPRPREGFDPEIHRPARIASGRTGFNDRELVLTLDGTGNRPMTGPDDGCKPEVRATVVADEPHRVVLDVQGYSVEPTGTRLPGRPAARACTAEYPMGHAVVHLPTPLGDRAVIDVNVGAEGVVVGRNLPADGTVPIIDASRWLEPGWLPDGFSLHDESGGLRYAPGPPTGTVNQVGGGPPGVVLSFGAGSGVVPVPLHSDEAFPVDVAMEQMVASGRAVTVRGRPGAFVQNRLVWREDDQWIEVACDRASPVRVEPGCSTEEDLLRIAESLGPFGR